MVDKLNFVLFTSVLVLISLKVGSVKCRDKKCTSESGKSYVCTPITECEVIISSLRRWKRPIPEHAKQQLRDLFCGFDGVTPKICCPQRISKHPNIHLVNNQTCGISNTQRIFGGSEAALYEFPWMALLAYRQKEGKKIQFQCGGSIINKRYVLTAAHCISDKLISIRLGEHDIEKDPDCVNYLKTVTCAPSVQDIAIEKSIPHEGYQIRNVEHDIALIRLAADVDMEPANVMPVCLPIYENLLNYKLEGRSITVTGWGSTELPKFKPSSKLLKVNLDIMDNDECRKKYQEADPEKHNVTHITRYKFCAGIMGKDSCRGDSGGPVVLPNMYENQIRFIQYGIVSYGSAICATGIPGVYTNIVKYTDWILDHLEP